MQLMNKVLMAAFTFEHLTQKFYVSVRKPVVLILLVFWNW